MFVLLLFAFHINPSLGHSQDRIEIFKIALDEPSGEINRELGRPIILRLHGSPPAKDEFHARLFRGTISDLKRQPADAQGCVQFNTVVLPVSVRGVIQMQSLDDPAWLNPVGDGFESEKYTIVFETGDQPSDSAIRINNKELDRYFKYSVSINLVPYENLKHAVKRRVDEAKAFLQQRHEAFQKITTSVCWGVKLIANAPSPYLNENVKVAELTPCTARPVNLTKGELLFASALFTNEEMTNE
jgi:hypothetical protein